MKAVIGRCQQPDRKVIEVKFQFSVKFGKTPLFTVTAHGRLIAVNTALIAIPRFWNFEAITALLA